MSGGKALRAVMERGKARAIKQLTFGKDKSAGRNSAGRITIFHRGGGSKRLQRIVDVKRNTPSKSTGIVERIEYDPNRSSRIALVRWLSGVDHLKRKHKGEGSASTPPPQMPKVKAPTNATYSFSSFKGTMKGLPSILSATATASSSSFLPRMAVAGAKPTVYAPRTAEKQSKKTYALSEVNRWGDGRPSKKELSWTSSSSLLDSGKKVQKSSQKKKRKKMNKDNSGAYTADRALVSYILAGQQLEPGKMVMNSGSESLHDSTSSSQQESQLHYQYALDPHNQVGNCIPLADMRLGTFIHSIELLPGQGAQLTRAAGTHAKIVKKNETHCLVRLPSNAEKVLDSRCRATIGMVSNPNHGARKLVKAGQSRWLGRRPVVRGVAMNPVDHPHGGGEGRTKGGRPSVSPWGKPTKAGYKTRSPKKALSFTKSF
ncbi:hypothetical protein SUGI_0056490 [Cryptomeria japonica]|nr:hypothetical protein SUGI_0056490 [Cryptomeria japonica]